MTRAAIYVRISADREGRELGVERQEQDCRALAERRGLTVAYVASDNDISASTRSTKPRPAYKKLLADVDAGIISAIIASTSSRLTRRPREWEDLIDLYERTGVHIYFVRSNDPLDLSTARGRRHARDDAARDAEYAEEISELARRERAQRREQGRWNGGKRPFGWEKDGTTPRPDEQAMIRAACEAVLAGISLRSLARRWTAEGRPTPQGGQDWIPNTIRDIIRNPRIAGLMPDERPATWPAIVDEGVWRGVCAVLDDPSRDSGRGPARLLTSIAYCGVCDPDGTGARRPSVCGGTDYRKNPLYTCGVKRHLCRRSEPVDRWVTDVILTWLARERIAPPPRAEAAPLASLAAGLRARRTEAAALFAAGKIDAAQLGLITVTVNTELVVVEAQLVAATSGRALSGLPHDLDSLREGWASWDLDRRRAILRATGLRIVVYPPGRGAKRFDPATVRIG